MPGIEDFAGKVAVVTGGASGIGYALAQRFLEEGMSVAIADVEQSALDSAVASLSAKGRVIGVPTDVRDIEAVENLARTTLEQLGRVDVVCNNAGVETGGSFLSISESAWRWVMDVNFFGVLNGCRVFLPLLEANGGGHIVNTASVAAFNSGTATMTPYCASKFAVLGMSECLEVELRTAGSNVGVSLLAPGPVKTRMVDAERNRPQDVAQANEEGRVKVMERLAAVTAQSGLEPAVVADQVLEAIRNNTFFVLPHPDMATAGIQRRMDWMATGTPPPVRQAGS
ncbi:SDR family NAD(P)-dependent oxidoreductase [Paeniglutamicibacter sp. ORCA_105]|uniref:SDR family NAD(P)-dependent oxidoreductase n=1 Tax=Paeniglutamicibacter sp. ORCA_105 TaxID=3377336 RepID=UPI00389576EC